MRQYFLSFFRSLTPGLGKRACPSSRRTRSLCRWRQTPSEVMLKETSFSFTLSCFRNAWHSVSIVLLLIFIVAVAGHSNFFINTDAICHAIGWTQFICSSWSSSLYASQQSVGRWSSNTCRQVGYWKLQLVQHASVKEFSNVVFVFF